MPSPVQEESLFVKVKKRSAVIFTITPKIQNI